MIQWTWSHESGIRGIERRMDVMIAKKYLTRNNMSFRVGVYDVSINDEEDYIDCLENGITI